MHKFSTELRITAKTSYEETLSKRIRASLDEFENFVNFFIYRSSEDQVRAQKH